jgi:hypothetical protein
MIERMAQQCVEMMGAMGSNKLAGMMGGGMWMMLAWSALLVLIVAAAVVGTALVLRVLWRRTS